MGTHKMYYRNHSDTSDSKHSRVIPYKVLGRARDGNPDLFRGYEKMNFLIYFHKGLFVLAIVLAFFQGAINQGRADLLERQNTEMLIMLDVKQLTELQVDV